MILNNPLVSVIIPNYNHARYLPERMESVLGQSYQNFEVIILDDCSTDNSREVIERYRSNPHISKIVYNEENSGRVFKQWKKGLSMAKGELLWIAESDDKCEPTLLEQLVKRFSEHPSLSLVFCRSLLFNDEGRVWISNSNGPNPGVYESHLFITRYMSYGNSIANASSCLFSKKALDRIDERYTNFRCSGDRMFWTLISEQGDVAVVDENLNYYRQHGSNTTSYGFQNGINQKETKLILDYLLDKEYINKDTYRKIRRFFLKKMVFELLTDDNLKKEIYAYWGYGKIQQLSLRLEAYYQNLFK